MTRGRQVPHPDAGINLMPIDLFVRGLRYAVCIRCNGLNRSPLRGLLGSMLLQHTKSKFEDPKGNLFDFDMAQSSERLKPLQKSGDRETTFLKYPSIVQIKEHHQRSLLML